MVKVSKKWPRRIILDFWRDAWALFSAQIFQPRSGPKIRSTASRHYDAATTPILPVPRPILFHSVSLECMCNLSRSHSIYLPRNVGCQIGCIASVGGIDKKNKSHKKPSSTRCIIWHYWPWNNHYNTWDTLSNPKFCAESVFDVGGVWFSTVTAVYWR